MSRARERSTFLGQVSYRLFRIRVFSRLRYVGAPRSTGRRLLSPQLTIARRAGGQLARQGTSRRRRAALLSVCQRGAGISSGRRAKGGSSEAVGRRRSRSIRLWDASIVVRVCVCGYPLDSGSNDIRSVKKVRKRSVVSGVLILFLACTFG